MPVAVDTAGNKHVFDRGENALLLIARQLADFLEDQPGFSVRRGAPRLGFANAEQLGDFDLQNPRQLDHIFGIDGYGMALPNGVSLLSYAETLGDFCLGKACRFAGTVETFSEWASLSFCGATGSHVAIIHGVTARERKCLHSYQKWQ